MLGAPGIVAPGADRAPLMLPCTVTRGFERQDLPRSGSANEILAVNRENVPERALYFLQHRWRQWDLNPWQSALSSACQAEVYVPMVWAHDPSVS